MLGLGKAVTSFGGAQNSQENISSAGMWDLQPLEMDPVSQSVVVLDAPCSPLVVVVVPADLLFYWSQAVVAQGFTRNATNAWGDPPTTAAAGIKARVVRVVADQVDLTEVLRAKVTSFFFGGGFTWLGNLPQELFEENIAPNM